MSLNWISSHWRFSLMAQMVKNLPAMQENWVQSLGLEDPWRRKWQPIPVFLPGESQGRRSHQGCYLWGRTESDTTEATFRPHSLPPSITSSLLPRSSPFLLPPPCPPLPSPPPVLGPLPAVGPGLESLTRLPHRSAMASGYSTSGFRGPDVWLLQRPRSLW